MRKPEYHEEKKIEIMENAFRQYCETGLHSTGIQAVAVACGLTRAALYTYFEGVDDLILQSTAYCMAKVEDEFMALSPKSVEDIARFINEIPYWTAKNHGKKYRFMYQVYTSPKYLEHGKAFFKGVEERYTEYAKQLEPRLGIPWQVIQPLIFIFVRASVHYALFEDEGYLKPQMELLKQTCLMMKEKYSDRVSDENIISEEENKK